MTAIAAGAIAAPVRAATPRADAALANVVVTPADGRDYQQPSLALDASHRDRVALAYQEGGRHERCGLALSADGGRTWTARDLIGAGGSFAIPEGYAACWNPSVAYGDGALYYLFQTSLSPSNPYSHVMLAVSHDGGATFDAAHAVDPTSPVYPGKRAGGDWWPQMAVDPRSAVLYVTWSRFTPELDSSWILMSVSRDGGRNFSVPLQLNAPLEHDVTGPRAAVAPDGSLFVAWLDYTSSERGLVECSVLSGLQCPDWGVSSYGLDTEQMARGLEDFYRDEGARFDFTQGLGCENFVSPSLLNPRVGYYTNIERGGDCRNPDAVRAAVSRDGGQTAQEVNPPASTVGLGCSGAYHLQEPPPPPVHACAPTHYSNFDHNVVSAAVGPSGELVTAWWDSEGQDAAGPSRISVSLSTDAAQHWRATTPVGAEGHALDMQHRPALSIAPDGRLDVVYYDLMPDGRQNVYAVSASNARRGFSAPIRVSGAASSAAVGPISDDNRASFGDWLSVVSDNRGLVAAWTDARGPHQSIAVARLTATLFAGPPPQTAGSPLAVIVALGVGLALAVAAAAVWVTRRRAAPPGSGVDHDPMPRVPVGSAVADDPERAT